MTDTTVAAISTPRGKGGVAMIRISGTETGDILSKVFEPMGSVLPMQSPRMAIYGRIVSKGRVIDTGICIFYKGPSSYTGEDMAELFCHGGVAVTAECLEAVYLAGAREAGPGEFTKRAFISGKLTLTEAEAVGLLIDADTGERAALAASVTAGRLSAELKTLADGVSYPLSKLYAAIDYPDEEIGDVSPAELCDAFRKTAAEAKALADTHKRGSAVAQGVRCAIVGRPNGGKSSLYNRICGEDRAIVTDVAGTTRDVLTQTVSFGGVTLLLSDTAGIRESTDGVEKIGIERARREAEEAELILFVYDISEELTEEEVDFAKNFVSRHPTLPTIAVLNKGDLSRRMSEEDTAALSSIHGRVCHLSAASGEGIDSLAAEVARLYDSDLSGNFDRAVIWSASQRSALIRAADSLEDAAFSLEGGMFPDAACSMAEDALGELLRLDGRGVSEEIVSSIFAHFCVGK